MDGANVAVEYTYDANGNLKKDYNKKIVDIQYNSLNLPNGLQFTNGNTTNYVYDAAGQKLSVTHQTAVAGVVIPMTGVMTPLSPAQILQTFKTDYCGNMIYENGAVSKILTEEGYITFNGTTPVYHYYLKDHQGNNRVVLNQNGTVEQTNHFYPLGGLFGESTAGGVQPYKYNGKELDRMHGLDLFDYGARHYDAAIGRWWNVDPLAEKYYSISNYNYCANNPVRFVDPDGREVISVFNRETHKLYVLDLDHYNKALPIVLVSANDYQLGGIRDKDGNLTHNQVLVINNVFSGGQVENGKIVRDADDSRQKSIPNAIYDIVDNNADTKHTGWFRLDRQDNSQYNDKDDVTGRDGYRFHLGGLSWGCVTVDKTQDDAQVSWDIVTSILKSTSTTTVSEKRGRQWLNPFSKLTKYGIMVVKGADKIPYKQKEEQ